MSASTQSGNVLHPTADTFDAEVFESDIPVLVDFWAPWCPPCRMLKPTVEKLAGDMAGQVRMAFVNVDDHPALAERFGVTSIPALMIVKDGEIVDAFTGMLPEETLRERIEVMIEE